MAFDNGLLARIVQKFERAGTSLFVRAYNMDTNRVVAEYELNLANSAAHSAATANEFANTQLAVLAGVVAPPGDTLPLTANLSIDNSNYGLYNGRVLEFTGAFTVTITAGLPDNFGFAGIPPASGNASIAFSGTTGNGAGTTITKSATDILFAVVQRQTARNQYVVK